MWDIDLPDTDLDFLDTDIPSKHFVCLQDVLKTCLEGVLKTHLEDVLKTLQRNNFLSSKTSSKCLRRQKIVTLKTFWRCLQDMSWRPINVCCVSDYHQRISPESNSRPLNSILCNLDGPIFILTRTGRGIKILAPEQMLQRLSIALAQAKAYNRSDTLLRYYATNLDKRLETNWWN